MPPTSDLEPAGTRAPAREGRARPPAYAAAVALVGLVTAVAALGRGHLGEPDLVLLYLLAVVIAAARFGRGPSLLAAALSVLAFDFFFIPPHFTFLVSEKRFVLTFAIMLVVSLLTSGLSLRAATVNLLENAAQYTPAGSPLDISARPGDRGELVIDVADRGPGIPPGEESRLFEKFFRARKTGGESPGAGLGLAICRGVIGAHGGTISAANRPGGGALFRMTLPSAGPPPPAPPV